MSIFIKNSDIAHLNVFGHEIIISQLADDTTVFLKNLEEVPKHLQTINVFSKASGLMLNHNKCELFSIHECPLVAVYGIPMKSSVKYLGIHITKDQAEVETLNITSKTEECKARLNLWLQRDISILGRIFLTKMESLATCIYPAYSLAVSNRAIKIINQINFDYIWRKKVHYIKKGIIIKDFENGGLQAIDFDCINGTLKINWLKSFLMNGNSFWFTVPRGIFKSIGGIDFLLHCDFSIPKLPIILSSYHKQVLLYWKLIFKHNFSPHKSPIWNNRYILFRNKSLFYRDWLERGIW